MNNDITTRLADALRALVAATRPIKTPDGDLYPQAWHDAGAVLAAYDAQPVTPPASTDQWHLDIGPNGTRIVSARGAVCEMLAGYDQTREADARRILAAVNTQPARAAHGFGGGA